MPTPLTGRSTAVRTLTFAATTIVTVIGGAACTDPAASDVCALFARPGQAGQILRTAADVPVAVGLARPGIEVLEAADDRFQPEARAMAAALRDIERGDDPAEVERSGSETAASLDRKVAAVCPPG